MKAELTSVLTDEERQLLANREWASRDAGVQKKYSGKVIAVCYKKVIAAANTVTELNMIISRLKKYEPLRSRLSVFAVSDRVTG